MQLEKTAVVCNKTKPPGIVKSHSLFELNLVHFPLPRFGSCAISWDVFGSKLEILTVCRFGFPEMNSEDYGNTAET